MRPVFLLDRKGDKDEYISKNLKTFFAIPCYGNVNQSGFEALKKWNT